MTRRSLLSSLLAAVAAGAGLLIAAIAGLPALILSLSPLTRRRGPTWRAIGRLDDFNIGELQRATVELPRDDWAEAPSEKAVYVWRTGPEEVVVFSRTCTDLGCPVKWDAGSERFYCPCHGGIFAKNGEAVAGPPPRPLYRFATRLRDRRIEVDVASLPPAA